MWTSQDAFKSQWNVLSITTSGLHTNLSTVKGRQKRTFILERKVELSEDHSYFTLGTMNICTVIANFLTKSPSKIADINNFHCHEVSLKSKNLPGTV